MALKRYLVRPIGVGQTVDVAAESPDDAVKSARTQYGHLPRQQEFGVYEVVLGGDPVFVKRIKAAPTKRSRATPVKAKPKGRER